ncbi:hypothetical protein Tco_0047835 [Tanacetum coccineum]
MIESEKPLKKKDQIMFDKEVAQKLQAQLEAELEEEEKLARLRERSANIDDGMILFVELMDKRKKHFAKHRGEEQRRKPPNKAQSRKTMSTYLKNMAGYKHNQLKNKTFDDIQKLFNKEMKRDLQQESTKKQNVDADDKEEEDLKQCFELRLVKVKHGNTRLEEAYERVLWGDLKVMFEPDIEKKTYPLTPATITDMLNRKLQAEDWNKIFSAAGTKVNAAERLQLLEEFLLSEG